MLTITLRRSMNATKALAALTALSLVFTGCLSNDDGTEDDEMAFAGYALTADDESDDGFDEVADPAPFFEELGDAFVADEVPAADEVDSEPLPIEDGADDDGLVIRRTVLVVWGQPVLNPEASEFKEWDGAISSDVAYLKPLRKLKFEGQDSLFPDGDPHAITFSTRTRPHHDGILFRIIVPKDKVAGGTLTFDAGGFTRTAQLSEVLDGFHEIALADDMNNIVRIDTLPPHACDHGFVAAQWKRLGESGGVFGGKWKSADGEETGYWMGLWGEVEGKRRMKGVYLDEDKNFRGVIKGAYRPFPVGMDIEGGVFRAHWKNKSGEVKGALRGTYAKGEVGGQGSAHGRYIKVCPEAEGACSGAIEAPGAPSCGCTPADEAAEDGTFTADGSEVCACQIPELATCAEAPAASASGATPASASGASASGE